ncbi:MAG: D-amino-acid transaminase [Rhodospirillales bacterium]|nr:D-amino-acid transaminase [Rhodospirillales bacterium]
MSRIAYVDGRYLPHRHAGVSVEDRGYQFADGVYEVIAVACGRLVDEEPHLDRLDRSLAAVRIPWPMSRAALKLAMREVIRRNRIGGFGAIYLQITRGVAPRNHAFPAGAKPVVVMTARSLPSFDLAAARRGVAVISAPDERWHRPDIKSVSLLPNVLAKQRAVEAGAYEAWLVDDDGRITEGTASNAWIVTADGALVTRCADRSILAGITRGSLLRLATGHGTPLTERPFSLDEAKQAREAFLTSTTSWVKAVVRIDGQTIGDGCAGPLTRRLLDWYASYVDGGSAEEGL